MADTDSSQFMGSSEDPTVPRTPALPSRLSGLLGMIGQQAPPPTPTPPPAAAPSPVAPAVSSPTAGLSPAPPVSAARPAGPVPTGLGIQRGAPLGGLAGIIAQLAPVNDGFLKSLEQEHTTYSSGLERLGSERERILKKRDEAKKNLNPAMEKFFETQLDGLDRLEEQYPYSKPTPPKYQELPPPPPGTQLRPFGDPGQNPTAMQSIMGALDQLTLIASMGTALSRKNAAGAVSALSGAFQGWRLGDRERAETAWLSYNANMKQIETHNNNLSRSYSDEVRKRAFDVDDWQHRALLWHQKNEGTEKWLKYIYDRDVGGLEKELAENDKATNLAMENLRESNRLIHDEATNRRQSLKNFVDAIQKERGLDIRQQGVDVRRGNAQARAQAGTKPEALTKDGAARWQPSVDAASERVGKILEGKVKSIDPANPEYFIATDGTRHRMSEVIERQFERDNPGYRITVERDPKTGQFIARKLSRPQQAPATPTASDAEDEAED